MCSSPVAYLAPVLSCTPCEQVITLLLSLPIAKAWSRCVPKATIFGVDLNPGPLTVKEHVIIGVMSSVGAGSAYAVSLNFLIGQFAYLSCHF